MGNAIRFLRLCFEDPPEQPLQKPPHKPAQPLAPHGVSALARDLFNFEISSQVRDSLSQYVVSSKKAQLIWYAKLLAAWKDARPPPRTGIEATRPVVQSLKGHSEADVKDLLNFYRLPFIELQAEILQEDVKPELHTLPVEYRDVGDGDSVSVYVSVADPREVAAIPLEGKQAAKERSRALAARDFRTANARLKTIRKAGYRVKDGNLGRYVF